MLTFVLAFFVKVGTTTNYLPVDVPLNVPIVLQLKASLKGLAAHYDLPYDDMVKTLFCESRWHVEAYNPDDVTGRAVGIAQFHDDTFYEYARRLEIVNADIYNPYQQMEVMAYMWSIGLKNRWTCASKV